MTSAEARRTIPAAPTEPWAHPDRAHLLRSRAFRAMFLHALAERAYSAEP